MVDEVKKEEPLVTEEPKKEEKAEAELKQNVDDLIAELEKAGVSDPQQLKGKLEAGVEVGRMGQLLGDERKRVEALQTEIDKLKAQPPKEQDWDNYPEGKPIDIEAAIERGVDKSISKRELAARQAQEASLEAYKTITTDEDYDLVKEIWDEKIKNPAYIHQVQVGAVNPVRDFDKTIIGYQKKVIRKAYETIKELTGSGKQPVPHTETGEERMPAMNIVGDGEAESANRKFLNAINAKIQKGYIPTDDEEALIAEAVLMESPEG